MWYDTISSGPTDIAVLLITPRHPMAPHGTKIYVYLPSKKYFRGAKTKALMGHWSALFLKMQNNVFSRGGSVDFIDFFHV